MNAILPSIKRILLFQLLLVSLSVQAQKADVRSHNLVKDMIVEKFNNQDFKGIYELAGRSFKANFSEKDMVAFLKNYSILGKITSSSLLKQTGKTFEYRLQCTHKSLQLTLAVKNEKSFTGFGLDLFRLPAIRTRTNFISDNPLKTELDSVVQKAVTNYMSNKNVAGLSVGVMADGKTYSYNFGEMKKDTNRPTTNNTIYEIGSITKVFTGILLANAVLENKLKLDDDIRKYLNGNFPNLQYDGTPIKIIHLANLTSRIPSEPMIDKTGTTPMSQLFTSKFDDKMLSDILSKIVLDTLPGFKREYSNFAVCVLGKILEEVYSMNYEQILAKYITTPYKMKQTHISLSMSDKENYAQGYSIDGSAIPYWENDEVNAVGGIRSTITDMLLFMQEQLNADNKAAHLSHQLTFGTESRGKGLLWGISRSKAKNHLRWTHDGSTDGFASDLWILPEIKSGVVMLTNNGDFYDESFTVEIYKTIYEYLSAKK